MFGVPNSELLRVASLTGNISRNRFILPHLRLEIMQRSVDRKEEQTIHATLVQANYEETQARHQYAAQHPAYADGRVW